MQKVQPVEAGLVGFALARRHALALMVWAAVLLAYGVASQVVTIVTIGPDLAAMQNAQAQDSQVASLDQLARVLPIVLLLALIGLAVYAIFAAAVNRMLLRPEEGGRFFLRFGGDEVRVGLVLVVQSLSILGVYFVLLFVGAIVIRAGSSGGGIASAVIGVIWLLGGIALLVFLMVKFSLAVPETFARRELRIMGSWSRTRGHTWRLLGAYALAVLLCVIAYAVFYAVLAAVAAALGGGIKGVMTLFQADTSSFAAYFTPVRLIQQTLASLMSGLVYMVAIGPAAEAYRQLTGSKVDEIFA